MEWVLRFLMMGVFLYSSYGYADFFIPGEVTYPTTQVLSKHFKVYPEIKPYDEGYLKVSKRHTIYYAQFGNPEGVPALYLHGGPMAGNSLEASQYFDPSFYRIIIFDQRGSGKSTPHADVTGNTTQDLIEDIVKLKEHLNIEQWLVTGGSWGSTLAMAYGEHHPSHVKGFILRGIFDGSKDEFNHLIYDMGKTCPQAFEAYANYIPESERGNLLKAYYQRLMSQDHEEALQAAKAFVKYDTVCGALYPTEALIEQTLADDAFTLSISRGFFHYAYHDFFMKPKQIQKNINKINHLPLIIVHGQHDAICPASNAYEIYKLWPQASLVFVQDAGHFASEPGISLGLAGASDAFKQKLSA